MSAVEQAVFPPEIGQLVRGLPVRHLDATVSIRERLKICSGTEPIVAPNYADGARVPIQDWRGLTDVEFALLQDIGQTDDLAESIYIWRMPDAINQHVECFRRSISRHNDSSLIEPLSHTPEWLRGKKKLVDLVTRSGVDIGTKAFGHYTRPAGLVVTSVGGQGLMVGLHIDSWFNGTLHNRSSGLPNRLCLNLGPESRYFMFMNLPLSVMRQWLDDTSDDPVAFPARFMAAFPNYPVFRLEVAPGEGYIAPTEIMIHDATTMAKTKIDASFTILGNFDRHVVENLKNETERENRAV